ncbi:nickel-dependent hydrogenase large subunit [Pontibacterium sp.]|jgi:coenzyme F420-reducing hydrogenase alpha subunit|uniref:nickel-dependent hydrogenase large subunit n=1 Tax=Pontibacterium sp. TaxID=2036026 RepID=UPI0035642BC9
MNGIANLAGKIRVDVQWRDGVIQQVQLHSSRPREITRVLQAKPLTQALAMVPMIYSMCAVAQTVASLQAAESALGIEVKPEVAHARQLLVQAETARELGLRLSQYWLADTAQVVPLMQWFTGVSQELRWALDLNPRVSNPIEAQRISSELKTMLLPLVGMESELSRLLFGDASHTPIGEQLRDLQETFGDVELALGVLPLKVQQRADLEWIKGRLASDDAVEFSAMPDADGICFETGVWARNRESGLVVQGRAAGLNELTLRFLAMVSELQALPARMRSMEPHTALPTGDSGMGVVDAARGLLIHRIVLDGDSVSNCRVADYNIVAPTEWNFHPRGTLVQMLEGVQVNRERLHSLVEKLILLVDPCVAWEIEVGN